MIIHIIHAPVSARQFVYPIVQYLNENGLISELWVQNNYLQKEHMAAIVGIPLSIYYSEISLNPFKTISRIIKLYIAIKQKNPSIVHAHQMKASIIPMIASALAGVRCRIYHNHGMPYIGYRGVSRTILRLMERLIILFSTKVIFVSRGNMEYAIKDKLLENKNCLLINNGSSVGIDLKKWDIYKYDVEDQVRYKIEYNFSAYSYCVLFVGRPVKRKGFGELLQAWELGQFNKRGGLLICVGFDEKQANENGYKFPGGVVALGMMSDLRKIYASCDVVCLPSWHEGFPYAMLEANASRKPTIGTKIPGMTCSVQDGITGILVPKGDISLLCNAICVLESNAVLRHKMGENGRKRVESEFQREAILNVYLKMYRNYI